jgi:hypothetical protein
MTAPTPLVDHASLPAIASAPLPATYEAAKRALEQCVALDECKMWANRAEALASYARQAKDDVLLKMSMRVQARAIDRCGELLKQIEPAKTGPKLSDASDTQLGRVQAARDAGLSDRQRVTAIRVNNVPRNQFETMVESDNPPTVTKLAELGKVTQPAPDYLKGRKPADFEAAGRLIGLADYITDRSKGIDLESAKRGVDQRERDSLITSLSAGIRWLMEARDGL